MLLLVKNIRPVGRPLQPFAIAVIALDVIGERRRLLFLHVLFYTDRPIVHITFFSYTVYSGVLLHQLPRRGSTAHQQVSLPRFSLRGTCAVFLSLFIQMLLSFLLLLC